MEPVSPHPDGAILQVRVTPRAQPAGLGEIRNGRLVVRVGAAPVEGQANKAVLKMLATALGVATSRLSLIRGEQARDKTVLVSGRTAAQVSASLKRG